MSDIRRSSFHVSALGDRASAPLCDICVGDGSRLCEEYRRFFEGERSVGETGERLVGETSSSLAVVTALYGGLTTTLLSLVEDRVV